LGYRLLKDLNTRRLRRKRPYSPRKTPSVKVNDGAILQLWTQKPPSERNRSQKFDGKAYLSKAYLANKRPNANGRKLT